MRPLYRLIFLLSLTLSAFANLEMDPSPSFMAPSKMPSNEPRLMINNRPLAKINGKVISLYDVVKKMDLFLYQYYPEETLSAVDRYQYYMSRWEATLDDLIAEELILLDAEQKEIEVSDGEVREEMEERFGPNIMTNLDKVNLQYEEARDIIRKDLTVQQLIGMKVHAKAFQMITPHVIKEAYDTYLKENPPEDEWKYQVLSIRGKDEELCQRVAEKAQNLLSSQCASLEEVAPQLEEEGITLSVSDDYSGPTPKISKLHFDAIKALHTHAFSPPISQVSRFDNSKVVRIFHLKDHITSLPSEFSEMHDKLKNQLLFKTSDQEKAHYIQLLKKRFGYDSPDPKFDYPEDYHPFVLF